MGDWNLLRTLLYVVGIVLLLVEGLIPGLGISGIAGVICVVISVAMITSSLYEALLLIIGTIAIFVVLLLLLYKMGFAEKAIKSFVLREKQDSHGDYKSSTLSLDLVGKQGLTLSTLRPAGTIDIDGKRYDAVTQGEFIEADVKVKVIRIEGSSLVAQQIK